MATLAEVFDEAFALSEKTRNESNSSSAEYQSDINKCIHQLCLCQRLIARVGIFSANETDFDEIATGDLRFIIVNAMLGDALNNYQQNGRSKEALDKRQLTVEEAIANIEDFLQRCQTLKLLQDEDKAILLNQPIKDPSQQRLAKIAKYKRAKLTKERLAALTERVRLEKDRAAVGGVDTESAYDDIDRQHVLALIEVWIQQSLDNLESLRKELELLSGPRPDAAELEQRRLNAPPPRKPLVLTREMMQSKVFGGGYPSLPTMSIEEWADIEMARMITGGGAEGEQRMKEQAENIDEDALADDDEELAKARAMDEYKDSHRRGDGNRKNMG